MPAQLFRDQRSRPRADEGVEHDARYRLSLVARTGRPPADRLLRDHLLELPALPVGGTTGCIPEMARTAQKAGKSCVIGSNMETDLGQAAMVCLAASLTAFPVEQHASDLMTGMIYRHSSTNPPIALRNGRLETPRGIGFGVEPADEHASDH